MEQILYGQKWKMEKVRKGPSLDVHCTHKKYKMEILAVNWRTYSRSQDSMCSFYKLYIKVIMLTGASLINDSWTDTHSDIIIVLQ